jgi:hypothetical protein
MNDDSLIENLQPDRWRVNQKMFYIGPGLRADHSDALKMMEDECRPFKPEKNVIISRIFSWQWKSVI